LLDDAIVAQVRSDREDRESAHRELVGVACYGKVELMISDALDVIQQMAHNCEGNPFGQDVWQDFDHGDMVGVRFFVFNG
jgi:arginine utilization protein RocB